MSEQEVGLPRLGEEEKELAALAKLDYDATLRALTGFVSTSGQIRAIGIAAWGVVLGLSVNADSVALALLALLIAAMFAIADAYHAVLYRRSLSRAITLEHLLDAWVDRVGIESANPDAVMRTQAKLEMQRFGMQRSLKPIGPSDLLRAKPTVVFAGIYPVLLAAGAVTAVVLQLS